MRRVARYVVTFGSGLSLVLCITAGVLWARSYRHGESVEHQPKFMHPGLNLSPAIISNSGQLTFSRCWRWAPHGCRVFGGPTSNVVFHWQRSESDYFAMRRPARGSGRVWQTSASERWVLVVK